MSWLVSSLQLAAPITRPALPGCYALQTSADVVGGTSSSISSSTLLGRLPGRLPFPLTDRRPKHDREKKRKRKSVSTSIFYEGEESAKNRLKFKHRAHEQSKMYTLWGVSRSCFCLVERVEYVPATTMLATTPIMLSPGVTRSCCRRV